MYKTNFNSHVLMGINAESDNTSNCFRFKIISKVQVYTEHVEVKGLHSVMFYMKAGVESRVSEQLKVRTKPNPLTYL